MRHGDTAMPENCLVTSKLHSERFVVEKLAWQLPGSNQTNSMSWSEHPLSGQLLLRRDFGDCRTLARLLLRDDGKRWFEKNSTLSCAPHVTS